MTSTVALVVLILLFLGIQRQKSKKSLRSSLKYDSRCQVKKMLYELISKNKLRSDGAAVTLTQSGRKKVNFFLQIMSKQFKLKEF